MQKLGVCFGILSRITAAHCNQRIHNTNINFFPLPSPPTPLLGFMAVDSDISPRQGRLFNPWLHCTDYTYFSVLYCIVLYLLLYGLHLFGANWQRAPTLSLDRPWAISAELRFYFGVPSIISCPETRFTRGRAKGFGKVSWQLDLTETSHLVRYLGVCAYVSLPSAAHYPSWSAGQLEE